MIIRNETDSDIKAIYEVTKSAFEHHPVSNQTEQFIVDALRRADALIVSLVAEIDGRVVGHIAFSPVIISDGSAGWYGLGPVSVLPAFQMRGIGKSLIYQGLSSIRTLGAKGCVLAGDPAFYSRFGFRNIPDLVLEGIPQEYFLALPFSTNRTKGNVVFHEGFSAQS